MKTIVIGSLHTDLIATGIKQFPKSGENVYGKELVIGAGGKSRNIADMIANLAPTGSVAMIGKTVSDPYGLWKPPMDALIKAGVNTDFVKVVDHSETTKLPGIALIPVDEKGNNQIIVLPGISDDFDSQDIEDASSLFDTVSANKGVLVITLECPIETAKHAARKANQKGIKVLFDPGGLQASTDISELIQSGIFLIKPNEHETKLLTGVDVTDFSTAKSAAQILQKQGVENVLITVGASGAYLFSQAEQRHIPIPEVPNTQTRDETGCGDQTIAALCAFLQTNSSLREASELAILAGTLQFHRIGIQPVAKVELTRQVTV